MTTTTYENAPATKMLAVHCCVCARPLVDAESVELGIGPECRRKHGFDSPITDDVRVVANKIVHRIACLRDVVDGKGQIVALCGDLRALGLETLAERIIERAVAVVFIEALADDKERFTVKAPYSESAVEVLRAVPGRVWHAAAKVTSFPVTQKRAVLEALQRAYPGRWALGPKGPFQIGVAA